MDWQKTDIREENSNLIRVDFRKARLSIDFDTYFDGVKEIHCRKCHHRKPREGAMEMSGSWGYLCKDCRDIAGLSGNVERGRKNDLTPPSPFLQTGNDAG